MLPRPIADEKWAHCPRGEVDRCPLPMNPTLSSAFGLDFRPFGPRSLCSSKCYSSESPAARRLHIAHLQCCKCKCKHVRLLKFPRLLLTLLNSESNPLARTNKITVGGTVGLVGRRFTRRTLTWHIKPTFTDQSNWPASTCATRTGSAAASRVTSGSRTGTRTAQVNTSASWTLIIVCSCSAVTWSPSTASYTLNRCAFYVTTSVCLSVCPSVCLAAELLKKLRTNVDEILRSGWELTKEKLVGFWRLSWFFVDSGLPSKIPYQ